MLQLQRCASMLSNPRWSCEQWLEERADKRSGTFNIWLPLKRLIRTEQSAQDTSSLCKSPSSVNRALIVANNDRDAPLTVYVLVVSGPNKLVAYMNFPNSHDLPLSTSSNQVILHAKTKFIVHALWNSLKPPSQLWKNHRDGMFLLSSIVFSSSSGLPVRTLSSCQLSKRMCGDGSEVPQELASSVIDVIRDTQRSTTRRPRLEYKCTPSSPSKPCSWNRLLTADDCTVLFPPLDDANRICAVTALQSNETSDGNTDSGEHLVDTSALAFDPPAEATISAEPMMMMDADSDQDPPCIPFADATLSVLIPPTDMFD